ncbi:MAG: CBS domain-containing protein [Candidatus Cloacimonetes bacterium]|jgi:CBS domain-containing protein/mannitol/fructose-specific phosphotransferase system IIA component (Ntr-type)|nr:CBS domain-containing protein [Candidatus Cloacimonadota bacterium]MCK9585128.1 CBS domain-containing protein [Candidatus Cloacimonadota bacterium]MDY0228696.1 CBS domain-containing protein [Candidatus Cloacimonadaceae bacterium]
MYLSDLLDAKAILHITEALSKEQVYRMLVEKLCKHYHLPTCGDALLQKILQRDQVSSTAYPTGISIPHIRMDEFEDTVVAMAFLDSPLDCEGTPVHWVCLVITDKSSSKLYLNLVAGLLKMSKDTGLVKSMLETDGPGVAHKIKDLKICITKEITVADVMVTDPISIRPQASLTELGDLISTHRISAVPVTDENGIYLGEVNILRLLKVGVPDYLMMLDDVSFLRSYEPLEKLFEQEDILTVGEIMNDHEEYLGPDTSIPEAVFDMIQRHRRFYSVVDEQGKLVGVVTAMDIFRKIIKA